jgi:hypothetical protein
MRVGDRGRFKENHIPEHLIGLQKILTRMDATPVGITAPIWNRKLPSPNRLNGGACEEQGNPEMTRQQLLD